MSEELTECSIKNCRDKAVMFIGKSDLRFCYEHTLIIQRKVKTNGN